MIRQCAAEASGTTLSLIRGPVSRCFPTFMVALGLLVAWPQVPAFLGVTTGIGWNALLQEFHA
jgi:hypothetical protein